jgi:hypothetical protein
LYHRFSAPKTRVRALNLAFLAVNAGARQGEQPEGKATKFEGDQL